jgi:hypothetical protein
MICFLKIIDFMLYLQHKFQEAIMKRLFPLLILFFLSAIPVFSQTSDFGIWFAAKGTLPLTRSLDFKMEADVRTFENSSKIDEGFGEAGLSLQLLRFLSVAGSYRLTSQIEDDGNYYLRHKFFIGMTGGMNFGRVGLDCRLMLEHRVKTYIKNPDDEFPDDFGRIKVSAKYNIPKSKLEPVIYFETFTKLFEATEKTIEKYRLSAGCEYRMNKKNKIQVSYIYQRDYLPHLKNMNIISLEYDFKI